MGDDTDKLFAQFSDAVDRNESEVAGRLLSEHLGAFAVRDLDATRVAVAGLDIRLATTYPAVAVLHPRQHELQRLFPGNSSLPPFSLGKNDLPRLKPLYLMTFARETGRIKLAGQYADRIVLGIASPPTPTGVTSIGEQWLTWFQLGRTRLAAGELRRASSDFTTALGCVPALEISPPSRLTLGYLALVAALMGDITLARQHLDRVEPESVRVGTRLWGLYATARAIAEVEEYTPDCDEAVAALDRIEDPAPLWPYILLARTRYAELIGRVADSLAFIESADLSYAPEPGSFAHDVLVARWVEALIVAARLNTARSIYDERASDSPHCQVAALALLCGEQDYSAIDRRLGPVVATPNITAAQRVQAESFNALGQFVRDGAIPDYDAPGLGHALSLRAHRRVVLMFPPVLRDALEPYLSAELLDQWRHHRTRLRLWGRESEENLRTLTQRQIAMLDHLDQGRSYGEIAAAEQVSVNTVKSHLRQLYKKLGVSNSSDALVVARRWGLLDAIG